MKNIALFGATGSIGKSTLDVVAAHSDFRVLAISGHRCLELLQGQAWDFRPRWVIATDETAARDFAWNLPPESRLLTGCERLVEVAAEPDVDVVVSAIVGRAGLESTLAAVQAGKRVALANKESLVVGGEIVTRAARRTGAEIVPVDSEHSAIFQALQAGRRGELERIILTASGGAFRTLPDEQLRHVTIEAALQHPTWNMGAKVTLDSATLMNKALEIIEAKWLFDMKPGEISVMIHPQSVVHSLVEFQDGAVIAQLITPDMRLPIQYALTFPDRAAHGPAKRMDWARDHTLEFFTPDFSLPRYEALPLGLRVAHQGGTAGVVLNAANEVAAAAFCRGEMRFDRIVPFVRTVLEEHAFSPEPGLEELIALDEEIRARYGAA